MSTRSTVLSEETVADLGELFGPIVFIERDWIHISRRALNSSEEDGSITIPRELNSLATLRFLGLSKRR